MRIVTLLTDFGLRDGFVGVMKGVLLSRAPKIQLVDLSHEVAPGDVRSAAFILMNSERYFPSGTVHVVVVDPGVGSDRAALVARTPRGFYVGPDNGVLSWALRRQRVVEVRRIENTNLFLHPVSQTFHGRDIFAPVAAYLCRAGHVRRVGPPALSWVQIPWPEAVFSEADCWGEIVYVDRFGNALTNLPWDESACAGAQWLEVRSQRKLRFPVCQCYADARHGQPVAVPGSSGFWELALSGGSAAERLGLRPGDKVRLHKGRPRTGNARP
ncbi:MAG: SAM-dependent chlorinase/fluorinase [Verrucomicrobiota bacterium]|nr:SAM-dependent chlorinase/fluorinase [Verrucomicrobiota bacterium]